MEFKELAEFFEKLEKESSRLKMMSLIAELLKKASLEEIRIVVYLCQGKLAPEYTQLEFGLGEKFVIEAISTVSGHSRQEVENSYKKLGDLGLVAQRLVKEKKQLSLFKEKLSVAKVYENFLKIAKASGIKSQDLKIKLLAELLNSSSPLEARYIVRIPLGELRLGIGDPTIMDALALIYLEEFKRAEKKLAKELEEHQLRAKLRELIESKYNVHPDLGEIAFVLKEKGLKGLDKIKIQIGVPIRPTLAERLPSAEEIIKKLGRCAVEAKYDGFRLQCHKGKNKVFIFSRRQENITHMFPEIVEAIKKQIKAEEAIFEGEALAVNESTGEFFPFQITIQRKRKYEVERLAKELPLKLFVFDVMYLNGENLMDKPFKERRKILESIVTANGTIELTDQIITADAKRLEDYFNECIERGLEGIIAKDLNAKYIAGARKFAWIKLKRSYKGELTDTVDLVIVGYFTGKGSRAKFGLGALLCACYNADRDEFETVAKIGSGMSEEQMQEMEKMLSEIKVESKPARVVANIKPDFWVEPKYVIEVRADEITKSPTHSCAIEEIGYGLALRFPRMIKLRSDRSPEEATTTHEIIEMFEQQHKIKTDATEKDKEQLENTGNAHNNGDDKE